MPQRQSPSSNGFTLIELLVTTGITAFIILTISSLFMVFLLSNARTNTRSFVKNEGAFALGRIEFLLRNAKQLETNSSGQLCQDSMKSISFKSVDNSVNEIIGVEHNGANKVSIESDTAATQYLTSDGVDLENGSIEFSCQETNGRQTVTVTFSLSKQSPTVSENAPPVTTEEFSSVVYLRN